MRVIGVSFAQINKFNKPSHAEYFYITYLRPAYCKKMA